MNKMRYPKFILSLLVLGFTFSAAASESKQDCRNCHQAKSGSLIRQAHQPLREHADIRLQHGNKEMSCNFCHDKNNHNYLMQVEGHPADFKHPNGVCSQCHWEEFKSWKEGLHGKITGGWKGDKRERLDCTKCHNPHHVKFPQMKADKAPARPRLGIPKD